MTLAVMSKKPDDLQAQALKGTGVLPDEKHDQGWASAIVRLRACISIDELRRWKYDFRFHSLSYVNAYGECELGLLHVCGRRTRRRFQDFISKDMIYDDVAILLPTRASKNFPPHNFYRSFWNDIMHDAENVLQLKRTLEAEHKKWFNQCHAKMKGYIAQRYNRYLLQLLMYKTLMFVQPVGYVLDPHLARARVGAGAGLLQLANLRL